MLKFFHFNQWAPFQTGFWVLWYGPTLHVPRALLTLLEPNTRTITSSWFTYTSVSPAKLRVSQGKAKVRAIFVAQRVAQQLAQKRLRNSSLQPGALAAAELLLGCSSPGNPSTMWAGPPAPATEKGSGAAHNGPFDSTGWGSFRKNTFPATAPVTKASTPGASRPHRAYIHQEARAGTGGSKAAWLLGRWQMGGKCKRAFHHTAADMQALWIAWMEDGRKRG